jgi:hypothetical protein
MRNDTHQNDARSAPYLVQWIWAGPAAMAAVEPPTGYELECIRAAAASGARDVDASFGVAFVWRLKPQLMHKGRRPTMIPSSPDTRRVG